MRFLSSTRGKSYGITVAVLFSAFLAIAAIGGQNQLGTNRNVQTHTSEKRVIGLSWSR